MPEFKDRGSPDAKAALVKPSSSLKAKSDHANGIQKQIGNLLIEAGSDGRLQEAIHTCVSYVNQQEDPVVGLRKLQTKLISPCGAVKPGKLSLKYGAGKLHLSYGDSVKEQLNVMENNRQISDRVAKLLLTYNGGKLNLSYGTLHQMAPKPQNKLMLTYNGGKLRLSYGAAPKTELEPSPNKEKAAEEEAAQEKLATRAAAEKAENMTMSPVHSRKLRVRKCGSLAEIIKHDPEDSLLTYKITFIDGPRRGIADWVAARDVDVLPAQNS